SLGRLATPKEVAEATDLSEERVLELFLHAPDPVSLDEPLGSQDESSDTTRGDSLSDGRVGPDEDGLGWDLETEVRKLCQDLNLDARTADILVLRAGVTAEGPQNLGADGLVPWKDVAEEIGLGPDAMRTILQKLRAAFIGSNDSLHALAGVLGSDA